MTEKFEVRFKRDAEKELRKISQPDLGRLVKKIQKLAVEPRPPDAIKMVGELSYRVRQGDWRVVYDIDDAKQVVMVLKVAHRREVYRHA